MTAEDPAPLKVAFADFWCKVEDNPLYRYLRTLIPMEISESPDIVFFSCMGKDHRKFSCTRVFFTGENKRPDFSICDFALSFDHSHDERNYRLPLYRLYPEYDLVFKPKDVDAIMASKSRFCSFVYSNENAQERKAFFDQLSAYKQVDSGGKVMNNVGGPVPDKLVFESEAKFSMAFENSHYPGYTTEKLLHAFAANTVPIYWGNDRVHEDFNPKSFINLNDFASFDDAIAHVKAVDHDDALWKAYLAEPCFVNNTPNAFCDDQNVMAFLKKITSSSSSKAAHSLKNRFRTLKARLTSSSS